jgi:hypothetical protein
MSVDRGGLEEAGGWLRRRDRIPFRHWLVHERPANTAKPDFTEAMSAGAVNVL